MFPEKKEKKNRIERNWNILKCYVASHVYIVITQHPRVNRYYVTPTYVPPSFTTGDSLLD